MNNASEEAVVLLLPPRTSVTIDRDRRLAPAAVLCLMVSAFWRRARRGESLDVAEAPRNINVGWLDVVVQLLNCIFCVCVGRMAIKMAHLGPRSARCIFGFAVVESLGPPMVTLEIVVGRRPDEKTFTIRHPDVTVKKILAIITLSQNRQER